MDYIYKRQKQDQNKIKGKNYHIHPMEGIIELTRYIGLPCITYKTISIYAIWKYLLTSSYVTLNYLVYVYFVLKFLIYGCTYCVFLKINIIKS